MSGMNRNAGVALDGDAHLVQSIDDILSTPIGTRPMRRDYGSTLFELIDGPANELGKLRLFAAVADALRRWEPRITVTRIGIVAARAEDMAAGAFMLLLDGIRTDVPAPNSLTRLTVPLRNPALAAAA